MLLHSSRTNSALPRTGVNTEVYSYSSLSQLNYDPSCECLTPEVDQLIMLCKVRAMSDNGKRRPYVLKVRCALAKLWLRPLLVCEQDKVTSQKSSVLHSKVAMKGTDGGKKCFTISVSLICSLIFQLFYTDEAFTVNGRKHIDTPFLLLQDAIILFQIKNIWNLLKIIYSTRWDYSGVYFISLGLLNKKYNIMSKKKSCKYHL